MTNKSIRDYINLIENLQREGVAEEQLEETSPEAIAKIDQITRR
jgi:hypothetical protein